MSLGADKESQLERWLDGLMSGGCSFPSAADMNEDEKESDDEQS